MANRFPLIIDTNDGNKIKELPAGDNLDLSQSGIINVASITTLGQINAGSLQVNGQTLSVAALTGDYNDLNNTPTLFSGDYTDLSNKPSIPQYLNNLEDVSLNQAQEGQVLIWRDIENQWKPEDQPGVDLGDYTLGELSNVITIGLVENKFLKFYSGAWRPAGITWTEIQNKPVNLSQFNNDAGFITNETESQELTFENGTLRISEGNSVDITTMDITGSVFADNSTLLVDAVNGNIPGYVSVDLLKSIVDASADYAEFKTAILNL